MQGPCDDAGGLTDDEFTYGGTTYRFEQFSITTGSEKLLYLRFEDDLGPYAGDLALHVDGTAFAFSDLTERFRGFAWERSFPDWTVGQAVELSVNAVSPPPTGLAAIAAGASIDLAWTAPQHGGADGIRGYRIEVSADGGSAWAVLVPDTGTAATTYAHSGLSLGDTRHYRVSAIYSGGTGPASEPASATAGERVVWSATLTVGRGESGESTVISGPVFGYQAGTAGSLSPAQFSIDGTTHVVETLYRGTAQGFNYLVFALSDSSELASPGQLVLHLDSASFRLGAAGLTEGNRRFTWAVDGLGRAEGETVAVKLIAPHAAAAAPGAPSGLAAAAGDHRIDLAWTAPQDNGGAAITGYRIEVSADGGNTWTVLVHDTGTTAATYADSGLPPGDTRHYRVVAINAAGIGPASDPASATAGERVIWTATLTVGRGESTVSPGPVFGYHAGIAGTLSPAQFSIDGNTHTVQRLYRDTEDGQNTLDFHVPPRRLASPGGLTLRLGTAAFDLGESDGNTGNRRFTWNDSGLDWAVGQTVAVKLTGIRPPGAPGGLAAAAGSHWIDLAWTAPADDGGAAVTGYRIEVSADGGSSWTDLVADTGTAGTADRHAGLSVGDTRHYRVSAINAAGAGPPLRSRLRHGQRPRRMGRHPHGRQPGVPCRVPLRQLRPSVPGAVLDWRDRPCRGVARGGRVRRRVLPPREQPARVSRPPRPAPGLGRARPRRQLEQCRQPAVFLERRRPGLDRRRHRRREARRAPGRPRRPRRPGRRRQRVHPGRPRLGRPGRRRRRRHQRLPDRGVRRRGFQLGRPRPRQRAPPAPPTATPA